MGKPYTYGGDKKLTPSELLAMARAEAEDIIAAANTKGANIITAAADRAHDQARLIHELAYDQGMALAERAYASKEERATDQKLAREAILRRVADQRLRAASIEAAGCVPVNIKPAHRLENVEYLVSAGCTVEDALRRSGYNALDSFKRAASRHGRNDLVRYVSERLAA